MRLSTSDARRKCTKILCVTVRDVLRMIHHDGWYQADQRGSHRQFKHPVKKGRVTIAGHPLEEIDSGTYKSILKQAGLNP
jgi:predicted RNA binding protein YcfA (HicA-like mRNA interferase family)